MTKKKLAAIYARVSTLDQNPQMQLRELGVRVAMEQDSALSADHWREQRPLQSTI